MASVHQEGDEKRVALQRGRRLAVDLELYGPPTGFPQAYEACAHPYPTMSSRRFLQPSGIERAPHEIAGPIL